MNYSDQTMDGFIDQNCIDHIFIDMCHNFIDRDHNCIDMDHNFIKLCHNLIDIGYNFIDIDHNFIDIGLYRSQLSVNYSDQTMDVFMDHTYISLQQRMKCRRNVHAVYISQ